MVFRIVLQTAWCKEEIKCNSQWMCYVFILYLVSLRTIFLLCSFSLFVSNFCFDLFFHKLAITLNLFIFIYTPNSLIRRIMTKNMQTNVGMLSSLVAAIWLADGR